MTRRLIPLALLMLPLAACASLGPGGKTAGPQPPADAPRPPAERPPPPPPRPPVRTAPDPAPGASLAAIPYRCASGRRFTAAWGLPGDRVRVTAGGISKTLPPAPSASGARYSDGVFEIWGKGDAALLSGFPGGPYQNCRAG
jgi:membrane-bound inhibitor of C-type lysozyme